MSNLDFVNSILANPGKHQVNRAEKMDKTIEVMANNAQKIIDKNEGASIITDSTNRGYGQGRKMGD